MNTNRLVKITVINDLVCPNCYIGHHEMLSAISYAKAVLHLPLSFEIEFRPYRLIPPTMLDENTPKCTRVQFFQQHLGKEAFEGFKDNVIMKWAEERKLKISFEGIMSPSIRAHRLSRKAYLKGKQNLQLPVLCALFKAYLELSQDIADIQVLAHIGVACKVFDSKPEATAFLESNELEAEVLNMCEEAKNAGLTGIPSAIIDGKWLINGGQSSEVFVRIFKKLSDCGSVSAAPSPFAPMIDSDATPILC